MVTTATASGWNTTSLMAALLASGPRGTEPQRGELLVQKLPAEMQGPAELTGVMTTVVTTPSCSSQDGCSTT
jgi:hypothetical protein